MKYDKLVRDKMPSVIAQTGKNVKFRIITDKKEYIEYLKKKLEEEVAEYLVSDDPEEFFDIEDVLRTLKIAVCGGDINYDIRHHRKVFERGLFNKGICLLEVEESEGK